MGSIEMKNLALVLVTVTLLTLLALPCYAQMVPMSWGFPTLIQNNSLLSFSNSFALENQSAFTSISFPTMNSISGISASSFPTITQVSDDVKMQYSFSYMNEQSSNIFTYPWISYGFSPVPSLGSL
jgi:hypothetical protein